MPSWLGLQSLMLSQHLAAFAGLFRAESKANGALAGGSATACASENLGKPWVKPWG